MNIKMRCRAVNSNEQAETNQISVELISHDRKGQQLQEGVNGSIQLTFTGEEQKNGNFMLVGSAMRGVTSLTIPIGKDIKLGDEVEVAVNEPAQTSERISKSSQHEKV